MNKRLILSLLLFAYSAVASASEIELNREKIPTDRASILRGADHVINGCVSCHAIKYIRYNELLALGVDPATVDSWRASNPVTSRILAQMPPESAAAAFGGIVPPDLSLMAIARDGGEHYLYSYLMGYYVNDKGETQNRIYPGTRMPDILAISTTTDVKQRVEISTRAKEMTAFLNWAADPHAAERKQLGIYVIAYLLLLTVLLYLWKVQIWRRLEQK
ncbi:MAG: cytochrome c1 [Gallionellaceae bacterium]|jgi:cytochrome c1